MQTEILLLSIEISYKNNLYINKSIFSKHLISFCMQKNQIKQKTQFKF